MLYYKDEQDEVFAYESEEEMKTFSKGKMKKMTDTQVKAFLKKQDTDLVKAVPNSKTSDKD